MKDKTRVAVLFGGRSPEHDVSVVTGLQVISALDTGRYDPFPVYIDPEGVWWVGDKLRDRASYMLTDSTRKTLTAVNLDLTPAGGTGRLVPTKGGLFGKRPVEFDVALLAFHGLAGENGEMQSLFEVAGVPYTGMRVMASSVLMDKAATKMFMREKGISVLPCTVIKKPAQGLLLDDATLKNVCKTVTFPACVKPRYLGSSIGVAKVKNADELNAVLPAVFKFDSHAIVEPFVENLVEYNVAVRRTTGGNITLSAVEKPKRSDELLDFKQKYCSAGGKSGTKTGGTKSAIPSEGMLSLTRTINPDLPQKVSKNLADWATAAYDVCGGTGAPRIDFMSNEKTGELWLNEINPTPGSFGYFLWEAAPDAPLLFTELLTHLLDEAQTIHHHHTLPTDPVPEEARLFKRS